MRGGAKGDGGVHLIGSRPSPSPSSPSHAPCPKSPPCSQLIARSSKVKEMGKEEATAAPPSLLPTKIRRRITRRSSPSFLPPPCSPHPPCSLHSPPYPPTPCYAPSAQMGALLRLPLRIDGCIYFVSFDSLHAFRVASAVLCYNPEITRREDSLSRLTKL